MRHQLLPSLMTLALPLSAQAIYNNASKPGDPICAQSTVGYDPSLAFGQSGGLGNTVGGSGKDLSPAPAAPNDTTGHQAGATRIYSDLYAKGHVVFAPGERPDASSFTAYGKDGKPVAIASLKGKIVVVGFWSYRCEPSARMLMEMAQLFSRRDRFGFELLAVNFDASRMPDGSETTGGWAAIRAFEISNRDLLKDSALPFYVPGVGKEGPGVFISNMTSLPLIVTLDRDGRIMAMDMGYEDKEIGKRLSQAIRESQPAKGES